MAVPPISEIRQPPTRVFRTPAAAERPGFFFCRRQRLAVGVPPEAPIQSFIILREAQALRDWYGGLFERALLGDLAKLDHEVRLMPPSYVKAYVKRGKTDAIDAEASCEAFR